MKRLVKIIVSLACITGCFAFVPRREHREYVVYAADYSSNEDYYYELCSGTKLTDKERDICEDFRDYLDKKQKDLNKEIADTQAKINEYKKDIANQGTRINQINERIKGVEADMRRIEKSIATINANIETLNVQIKEREEKINELNEGIKARMAANQSSVSLNMYTQFIMGAESFSDLIRRVSALQEFTEYDNKKMEELEVQKRLLKEDMDALQEQKDNLVKEQTSLETTKANLKKLKAQAQELINEYRAKKNALEKEMDSKIDDLSALSKAIKEIDTALEGYYASKGWSSPLKSRFYVSSGCFYYNPNNAGSGFHPAVDLAVGYGTNVYAVANGYVVATHSGCPSGYLGSRCGNGHGNYVLYVVIVNKVAYEIISQHLSSVNVKVGDLVYAGTTVIGKVGSSGSSSGAHLHLNIIRMGSNMSIKEAASKFQARNNYYFGVTKSIAGACYYKGSAPCFENPMTIYGIKYRGTYTLK